MPVSFTRLKIAGFKSFAEPTTLDILPGLTGIVGPNGCGKSNIVEALRWAMGESSARSLRGGEMDDVIFAGTAHRPSRNLAEVALTLDDAVGRVPPPFHETAELEITRRIERAAGSAYRINGREVRARDVQTLFADLASGARASAMVSQGRVAALVNARPDERRGILEEAAGITGLHARRHEAELRLRAAESNLVRAEELRATLDVQVQGLKRQARQANRYRNLSGAIRAAETEWLAIQLRRAEVARTRAREGLAAAEAAAGAAAEAARAALARAEAATATLPALRAEEAEARTRLERARVAREQIAAEERRAKAALAEALAAHQQIARDRAHAAQLNDDATAALARLEAEAERLRADEAAAPARLADAEAALAAATDAARAAEAQANRATEAAAEAEAQSRALATARAEAETRARRASGHLARLEEEAVRLPRIPAEKLAAGEAAVAAAGSALVQARAEHSAAEAARPAAEAAFAAAREAESVAQAAMSRVRAEAEALAELLAVKEGERWPRMVDALEVPAGLEAALGAALGEELESASDPAAPRHWRELPPLDPPPALPAAVSPLAALVHAPAALARALAAIGLVADEAMGDALQALLAPGQILVSREGAVWRWDGYCLRAGTPTAAAVRLAQRNRLSHLRAQYAEAEAQASAARDRRLAAEAEQNAARALEKSTRDAARGAEQAAEAARAALARLAAEATEAALRAKALEDQRAHAASEAEEAQAALAELVARGAALPDMAAMRAAREAARAASTIAREAETKARRTHDALLAEAAQRAKRLAAISAEHAGWQDRARDATARGSEFAARETESASLIATREAEPERLAASRDQAAEELAAAEAAYRGRKETLAQAEQDEAAASRAAREAEAALARALEAMVRAEGEVATADHAWGVIAERVLARLGVDPAFPDLPDPLDEAAEDKARKRFERLSRERDEMGPVNLRAEIEASEIEAQIETITRECADITTAIAKLRGSIGHLNREGRERLAAVFAEVDRHFQALFARMFGGGRAHLALVGSDDPLLAGLEIYAQPPGKKLATLSLLSGGEQALTALSLIFAVFRCNPAPVCVLDEVDAPLDDANVERFCTLLEDMVRETGTRFLVVTHHHLTMARMDRLFGVTMQERGVSRLLSVDLVRAAELVDPPRMAAE